MLKPIFVHGVGIATDGLLDWASAQPVLRGEQAFAPQPLPPYRTTLLPRNESRRAGAGVNLAFRVAEQACGLPHARDIASVFVSSAGDIDIADWLCAEVNTPARAISPTRFHNSVHNAAAGYWSIATGCHAAATSLSGGMGGFAIGLCEAWGLLAAHRAPVLMVCFDMDGSGLLHAARPDIDKSCAVALLLDTQAEGALASLARPVVSSAAEPTRLDIPALEHRRQVNPTGRSLPLLAALAGHLPQTVVVESEQGHLQIDVAPAS